MTLSRAGSQIKTHAGSKTGTHGMGAGEYIAKSTKASQVPEFPFSAVVGKSGKVDFLTTDYASDDVAIQAAIDYVETIGGGVVFLKKGAYLLENNTFAGNKYQYYGIMIPGNVSLIGEGILTVLQSANAIPSDASSESYFVAIVNKNYDTSDSFILIRDIKIDMPEPVENGTGMTRYDTGIIFQGANRSIVENVTFVNSAPGFYPNSTYANTADALTLGGNYGNIVSKCNIINETGSSAFFQGIDCLWTESNIYGAWDDAILIGGAGGGHRIINSVIDNRSPVAGKGAASGCIMVANDSSVDASVNGMYDILISGCTLRNCTDLYSGSRAGVKITGDCRDVTISRNHIYGNYGMGVELDVLTYRDIIITDNQIYANGGHGVKVQPTTGEVQSGIIRGNVIKNNCQVAVGNAGLYVYTYGSTSFVVQGNTILDDQGTPTQTSGIALNTEPASKLLQKCMISGNMIDCVSAFAYSGAAQDIPYASIHNNQGAPAFNFGVKSTAPTAYGESDRYYDLTTHTWLTWNGSSWV